MVDGADTLLMNLPQGHLRSQRHSLLVSQFLLGQFRIQLTRIDRPDAHAPPGHSTPSCANSQRLDGR